MKNVFPVCASLALLLAAQSVEAQDASAAAERARIANQRIIADAERRRAEAEDRSMEEERQAESQPVAESAPGSTAQPAPANRPAPPRPPTPGTTTATWTSARTKALCIIPTFVALRRDLFPFPST